MAQQPKRGGPMRAMGPSFFGQAASGHAKRNIFDHVIGKKR
jgi:hypothetical protein